MLKLVVVLFNLKNGVHPTEVRDQINLEKFSNRTDELCNETNASKSDQNALDDINYSSLVQSREQPRSTRRSHSPTIENSEYTLSLHDCIPEK